LIYQSRVLEELQIEQGKKKPAEADFLIVDILLTHVSEFKKNPKNPINI